MRRASSTLRRLVDRWRFRANRLDPTGDPERGETLVEVLLALVVLSLAGLALLTGFATSIYASGVQRNLASLDSSTRIAANEAIADIQQQSQQAAGTANDPFACQHTFTPSFSNLTGTSSVTYTVLYWDGSSFGASTCVTYAPQQYSLTITTSSGGQTYTAAVSTVVYDPGAPPAPNGVGSPTELQWLQPPGGGTTSTPLSPQPEVAVEDASGNIVTSDFSSVTLQVVSGPGTLSSTCSGVESYGVVQFSGCSLSASGSYTLRAVDSNANVTATPTAPVTVNAAPPAKLVITSSPVSGTASNKATLAITVTEEDAFGNATTAAESLSLGTSSSGGVFAVTSGGTSTTTTAISAGSSTATFYYGDTVAGSPTLTLSASGLAPGSQTETISAGTASKLGFTTSPFTASAGSSAAATTAFTIALEDTYGNPTASGSATVSLSSSSSGPYIFNATKGATTPTGSTTVSITSGSKTVYYGDTKTGAPTITASATGFGSATQAESMVGGPTQLKFTTSPVAGDAYTDANIGPITVTEETAGGTPTTVGETVSLSSSSSGTYVLNTTAGATSPTGSTTVSIPAGQSSVTFYYGDTKAGSPTITASASGLTSATQVETVDVGPLAAFLVATPSTQTAGTAFNETVTAVDAGGNTVTSYGGSGTTECVTFSGPADSPNGSSPAYPTQGTCPTGSAVTFTNGVGTASITLVDAQLNAELRATAALITGVSGPFTVNAQSTPKSLSLSTPTATAGQAFVETLEAVDTYGNTTTYGGSGGTNDCVTFSGPSSSPGPSSKAPAYPAQGTCASGQSQVRFTAGVGSPSLTLYDAQTTTLTATVGSYTGTSASFTVSAGSLSSLSLANPGAQIVATPFTVTVTGTDAYSNPYTGSFSTGAGTLSFGGPHASPNGTQPLYPASLTFSAGQASASVTLYKAETTTLQVVAGGVTATSASFTVSASSLATFSLSTPTPTAGSAFTETVTAGDTYGNADSGFTGTQCVQFSGPGSSPAPSSKAPSYPGPGTCSAGSALTFTTSGQATASITLYAAGATTLSATDVANTSVTGSVGFTVNGGSVLSLSVQNPGAQVAGGGFSLTVGATDAYSNPYSGTLTTATNGLAFSGPGNSPAPTSQAPSYPGSLTFTGGVASAPITLYDAQSTSITVSATGDSAGSTGTFAVAAGTLHKLALSTPGATAGAPFTETVSALDTWSNPASGWSGVADCVAFSGAANSPAPASRAPSYPPVGSCSSGSALTFNASGQAPATITLYDAVATTLTATSVSAPTGVAGSTASFTVGVATPYTVAATSGSGQTAHVSTAFSAPLVATVTDPYGNPVSGTTVTFAAPATGASVTFATGGNCTSNPHTYSCAATTNASGVATSSTMTANATAGTNYAITATASSGSSTFTETNSSTNVGVLAAKGANSGGTTTAESATLGSTPSSGSTLAVLVYALGNGGAPPTPTISGSATSGSATPITTVSTTSGNATEWAFDVTASGTGTQVTASFSSSVLDAEVDVVALTGNNLPSPVAQFQTNTGHGAGPTAILPSTPATGDLEIIFMGTSANSGTITTPGGWTKVNSGNSNSPSYGAGSFYETGGTTSQTISIANSSYWATIAIDVAG